MIYEKVVANQLMEFLNEHKPIDDVQHGFLTDGSVTNVTMAFIESIIELIKEKLLLVIS